VVDLRRRRLDLRKVRTEQSKPRKRWPLRSVGNPSADRPVRRLDVPTKLDGYIRASNVGGLGGASFIAPDLQREEM
jgi:hypothetical protein